MDDVQEPQFYRCRVCTGNLFLVGHRKAVSRWFGLLRDPECLKLTCVACGCDQTLAIPLAFRVRTSTGILKPSND